LIGVPDAYHELHAQIAAGDLLPGERLVETELADKLKTGRTAIRTALARLEQDGLVEHQRNRGARVRRISTEESIEVLEARCSLEAVAAGYAAQRATANDARELAAILDESQRLFNEGDVIAYFENNALFHRRILEISGHATAQRICKTLNSQLVRFQYRASTLPGSRGHALAEYAAIVDAITAGDSRAAERAVREQGANVIQTMRESATRAAVAA
jgi:DNA-binding GntR family transcriptional regulator